MTETQISLLTKASSFWKGLRENMASKTTTKKDWKSGWPKKQGWYLCLVDGEEKNLRHFICEMSNRHEWVRPDGSYEYAEVQYLAETPAPKKGEK